MGEDIVIIILDTGEYMMGILVGGDAKSGVMLDKPVAVQVREDGQGLLFMPYLQLVDETQCEFKAEHVRHVLTPKGPLIENYRKQYGSGLVVPPKQNILT